MQEITIILGSLAGIATAVAISRRPKTKLQSLGASSQIREQITSLKIERDILTKTISRLYENDESFSKIQKDKLLSRYQHQLGIILARIEKLEQASEHPDLGPVGDGLITLMDQKLSKLDDRLYELSSKIVSQSREKSVVQSDVKPNVQSKIENDISSKISTKTREISSTISPPPNHTLKSRDTKNTKPRQSFEITTLTNIPQDVKPVETDISKLKEPVREKPIYKDMPEIIPDVTQVKPKNDIKHEIVNVPVTSDIPVVPNIDKPKDDNSGIKNYTQESLPKIKPSKPNDTKQDTEPSSSNADLDDDESLDDIVDDDESLEKIQNSIDKILSEMNQAEVE